MKQPELYQCPYDMATRCSMEDPCKGCETWAGNFHAPSELRNELNRYKQALTRAVALPKGQLPHGQGYFTCMLNGNVVVKEEL